MRCTSTEENNQFQIIGTYRNWGKAIKNKIIWYTIRSYGYGISKINNFLLFISNDDTTLIIKTVIKTETYMQKFRKTTSISQHMPCCKSFWTSLHPMVVHIRRTYLQTYYRILWEKIFKNKITIWIQLYQVNFLFLGFPLHWGWKLLGKIQENKSNEYFCLHCHTDLWVFPFTCIFPHGPLK